jgi:hypothetical protein
MPAPVRIKDQYACRQDQAVHREQDESGGHAGLAARADQLAGVAVGDDCRHRGDDGQAERGDDPDEPTCYGNSWRSAVTTWPVPLISWHAKSISILIGMFDPSPRPRGHGGQTGANAVRPRPTQRNRLRAFAQVKMRSPVRFRPDQGTSAEIASGQRGRRFIRPPRRTVLDG